MLYEESFKCSNKCEGSNFSSRITGTTTNHYKCDKLEIHCTYICWQIFENYSRLQRKHLN